MLMINALYRSIIIGVAWAAAAPAVLAEPPVIAQEIDRNPALIKAVKSGRIEEVKSLLEAGDNVNQAGYYGMTALMIAAENGYTEILKLLLVHGAEIDKLSPGYSALVLAAGAGQIESAKILLEAGAEVNLYVDYNTDTLMRDCKNKRGFTRSDTALLTAANNGHIEIVKLLLNAGADPNQRSGHYTVLMRAAIDGQAEIIKLLVQAGADPNLKSSISETALLMAARYGQLESIVALVEGGADPAQRGGPYSNDKNLNLSYDALEVAVSNVQKEAAKLLINYLITNPKINLKKQLRNIKLENKEKKQIKLRKELIQYCEERKKVLDRCS